MRCGDDFVYCIVLLVVFVVVQCDFGDGELVYGGFVVSFQIDCCGQVCLVGDWLGKYGGYLQ